MSNIVISGSGLFIPPHYSNDELIEAYNAYVPDLTPTTLLPLKQAMLMPATSSGEFVEKASGIKSLRDVQRRHAGPWAYGTDFKPALLVMGLKR